jgi:hypothetical protein
MDYCVEILNFKSKFGKQLGVSCESEGKMYSNGIVCKNLKQRTYFFKKNWGCFLYNIVDGCIVL